ncbi:vWA domain-containing protein [Luteolibacter marinus]|uniref:vWA domain-containing protein n=1 Tax=Luteolibacter marinus TaxID=2776705 RepID=UPI001866C36D|nr:VWA domain-containing protein [Luteolibacter marinus]
MSDFTTNFHFLRPAALLLVPVGALLWAWWRRRADPLRGWRDQIDRDLLQALRTDGEHRTSLHGFALPLGWLLAALAVAGPTWKPEPSPFADDASPLVVLLKADLTMDATDPAPSRIERAGLKLADLAQARRGQPLGLIAYAGSAHLVLPPTRDTAIVAGMAAEISPSIMPVPGDRLDLALARARDLLAGQGGSVLVVADSIDTDPALLEKPQDLSIQILAINSPGSSQEASTTAAGRSLGATVTALAPDDRDIDAIVRRAARPPVARAGEGGTRWQEAGYWLVPVIALLTLAGFRREQETEVTA